jgi:hypothetical protein
VLLSSEEQKEPHSHEAVAVLIILTFILHLQGRVVNFLVDKGQLFVFVSDEVWT